jgi:DNA/RNA endonuclease YhcR with UshA esterase domain
MNIDLNHPRRVSALLIIILLLAMVFPGLGLAGRDSLGDDNVVTIATARQLPLGTEVILEGSVSVPSGAYTSSTFDQGFGIQDDTAGIYVSIQTNLGLNFHKRVRVHGTLDDDGYGQLVLRPTTTDDVELLSGAEPVFPTPVLTGDVNEATEGLLVEVEGVITRPLVDDTPYGYSVFIDDDSGETQVFIPVSTGVNPFRLGYMEPGQRIRAAGQSSQFKDQYEVLPRFHGDLRPAPKSFGRYQEGGGHDKSCHD